MVFSKYFSLKILHYCLIKMIIGRNSSSECMLLFSRRYIMIDCSNADVSAITVIIHSNSENIFQHNLTCLGNPTLYYHNNDNIFLKIEFQKVYTLMNTLWYRIRRNYNPFSYIRSTCFNEKNYHITISVLLN